MNVYNCFIYLFALGHATRLARSSFLDQGLNMHSQQWKWRALTTGLSGNSHHLTFCSLHPTDGEKVEIVTDFLFLGFKITADGDCSHEIRRWLFLGRKAMRNLAAAAKSLQSCPTLCDPIDGSPPGSPVPGILQARTLEWVAISFSKAWKWKVKVKSLSHVWLLATPWTAAYRLLHPWDFPGKSTGVGCHCLLHDQPRQHV